jgi:elongation of very long chain fatty acids protein 4
LNVGYDGDVYLTIVLNGFIHTVMYTYYFVSLHAKDIWWKSALTMCQMVQFLVMNAQAIYLLVTGCTEFPKNITMAYGYYIVSLLILFAHFFVTSYMMGGSRKKKASKDKKNA